MSPDRDATLAGIRSAYKLREYARARELAAALVRTSPSDADGWMWTGIVALSESRYADALAAFERKVSIAPDGWSYVQLGLCHWKGGALDASWRCYTRALELAPSAEAWVALATVLHGLRRYDDALAALDSAARLSPGAAEVELRRGCTLIELGRFEDAAEAFERAVTRTDGRSIARFLAFDRPTYDRLVTRRLECVRPEVALERSAAEKSRAVVQVSCDPLYVRKFGFAFVRSYAKHATADQRLHVHVYDPDSGIVEELGRVAAAAGIDAYTVSVESSPYAGDSEGQRRKAYYAAARLVHLPFWLEHHRAPIVSLDVDLIVEAPLAPLLARAARADVLLNRRNPPVAPWLDVVANVIAANPGPAAIDFFTCAGIFALDRIARDGAPWLMDQMSLFCVLKLLERFGTPPRVEWVDNAHDVGLWHLGHACEHLLDDPRFTAHT